MTGVRKWHARIFQAVEKSGIEWSPHPFDSATTAGDLVYPCAHCTRVFSTPQGRGVHLWKKHGRHAPEWQHLSGSTCPACNLHCWTTARLYQHLAYIPRDGGPNRCYAHLQSIGHQVDERERHYMDPNHKGHTRVESRKVAGPVRPCMTQDQRRLAMLEKELEVHGSYMQDCGYDRALSEDFLHGAFQVFTEQTQQWFQTFVNSGYQEHLRRQLQDRWTYDWDEQTSEAIDDLARAFLVWGNETLGGILSEWQDGEAEKMVEDEFYTLVHDLPPCQAVMKKDFIQNQLARQRTRVDCPPVVAPHRPVHRQGRNHSSHPVIEIPSHFQCQQEWDQQLRKVKHLGSLDEQRLHTPLVKTPQGGEAYIVVHLFSGRRREGDFHDHLAKMCSNAPFAVSILSLDTAVSADTGNLAENSKAWIQIDRLFRSGWVAFALAGSPCETFSEARHQQPMDEEVTGKPWPRPLRSAAELWGLAGLSLRELRQVQTGSLLHLQTLYLLMLVWGTGGAFVSEHPAVPKDGKRASTWTSAVMTAMRNLEGITLSHIQQYKWGAATVKPTALLHTRLPTFWPSINRWQVPDVQRPTRVAIGRDETGQFYTAQAKEYPKELGGAFAQLAFERLRTLYQRRRDTATFDDEASDFVDWFRFAVQDSGTHRKGGSYLPDYQPFRN